MNKYLKGNYSIKKDMEIEENQVNNKSKKFKDEYEKRAIESVSGSMVFIEKDMIVWDGELDE